MGKKIWDAFIFTLMNVGGSFVPLVAAVLYPQIFDEKGSTFSDLVGKGEITIMCIPMCISIAIVLYNYKKEVGISKLAHIVYIITFFWLIIAVGLYAYGVNKLDIPRPGLIKFSWYFLFWTIVGLFVSKFVEDEAVGNLKEPREEELQQLEDKFNKNRS